MDLSDSNFFAPSKHCKVEIDAMDMVDSDGMTTSTTMASLHHTSGGDHLNPSLRSMRNRRMKRRERRLQQLANSQQLSAGSRFFSRGSKGAVFEEVAANTGADISPVDPHHDYYDEANNDPSHEHFENNSLAVSLQLMRELRVDCNVVLVDPAKEHVVYVSTGLYVQSILNSAICLACIFWSNIGTCALDNTFSYCHTLWTVLSLLVKRVTNCKCIAVYLMTSLNVCRLTAWCWCLGARTSTEVCTFDASGFISCISSAASRSPTT